MAKIDIVNYDKSKMENQDTNRLSLAFEEEERNNVQNLNIKIDDKKMQDAAVGSDSDDDKGITPEKVKLQPLDSSNDMAPSSSGDTSKQTDGQSFDGM